MLSNENHFRVRKGSQLESPSVFFKQTRSSSYQGVVRNPSTTTRLSTPSVLAGNNYKNLITTNKRVFPSSFNSTSYNSQSTSPQLAPRQSFNFLLQQSEGLRLQSQSNIARECIRQPVESIPLETLNELQKGTPRQDKRIPFYHLNSIPFRNYKYPRPSYVDTIYSNEVRYPIPLYITQKAAHISQPCIEEVFAVQSHMNECESIKPKSNQGSKQDHQSEVQDKIHVTMDFYEYTKIKREEEKHKLGNARNHRSRSLYSRWRPPYPQQNEAQREALYSGDKQLNARRPATAKHQKHKMSKSSAADEYLDEQDMMASINNFSNQQDTSIISKASKLQEIIQVYNKMMKSNVLREKITLQESGKYMPNERKIVRLSLTNTPKPLQGVSVAVLVNQLKILSSSSEFIRSRILQAVGIQGETLVSLSQLIAIFRILIHRDSSMEEFVQFFQKFLCLTTTTTKKECKASLKRICIETRFPFSDKLRGILYEEFVQVFTESGILSDISHFADPTQLPELFATDKLQPNDMLDIITGVQLQD